MSASAVLADEEVGTTPGTARPYVLGGLAALSVGAAAIHFAVTFSHFSEYVLYGVGLLAEDLPETALRIAKKYLRPVNLESGR